MKHLNVISKPVERWFHYEKPLPVEKPSNGTLHFVKDHKGNDVMCWLGWEAYACKGTLSP